MSKETTILHSDMNCFYAYLCYNGNIKRIANGTAPTLKQVSRLFFCPKGGADKCQRDQSDRVLTPAVPS